MLLMRVANFAIAIGMMENKPCIHERSEMILVITSLLSFAIRLGFKSKAYSESHLKKAKKTTENGFQPTRFNGFSL